MILEAWSNSRLVGKRSLQVINFWWSTTPIFYNRHHMEQMFVYKCLFLFGVCWKIDYLLRIIWLAAEFFKLSLFYVLVVVGWRSRKIICFYGIFLRQCLYSILHWSRIFTIFLSDIGLLTSQFAGGHLFKNDVRTCFHIFWMDSIWIIWKD